MAEYDLVIRGGTLVDGTGAPARRADVAITGGRIADVGEVAGRAARTLDASGRVVAPGFIDLHTHYDAQLLWDRLCTISPWHGVTTVVIGNCGFGIAPTRPAHRDLILRTLENVEGMSLAALTTGIGPSWPFETFPQYLDAVERRGSAVNVGAFIGHTPVRTYVMGEEATERAATPDEVARMRALVAEGLAAGALGFSTSKATTHVGYAGRPVPSRAAELAEIEALAGALGDAGHGVLQATIGRGFMTEEFAAIARRTGRPVTWTALLAGAGSLGPTGHRPILARHAELQREGVQVVPQVACRPLMFEYQMKAPFPFESSPVFRPVSAADRAGKRRIYADPAFRAELARSVSGGLWARTEISWCPSEPALEGQTLDAAARARGVEPSALLLDLSLANDLEARFRLAVSNVDESAVAELLTHPCVVLGLSDAGAHASQLCDANFATHLLAHWVRAKGVLSLEQAVRLLSSRSAELLGLHDRGRLAPGMAADVTVFDPDRVGTSGLRRVHDLPAGQDRLVADALGIDWVIANGTVIREHGKDALDPDGPLPGRLLRGRST